MQGLIAGTPYLDLKEECDEYGNIFPREDPKRSVIEVLMAATKSSGYQGSFICVQCNESFTHSETLASHLLTHAGENPLVCCVCNERFFDNETLKIHLKLHSGGKTCVCVDCNQMFSKGTFFLHLQKHSSSKNLSESQPRSPTPPSRNQPQQQQQHQQKQKKNSNAPVYCTTCQKRFVSLKQLSRHSRSHGSNRKQYKCSTCNDRFSSETMLEAHSSKHKDSYQYACTYCNVQLTEDSLTRNLVNCCNKCVTRFRRENASQPKPAGFSCLDCDFVCKRLVVFQKHLRSPEHGRLHSNKFTLACSMCDQRFASKALLNTHLEEHVVQKQRRFVCATCCMRFYFKPDLDQHLKSQCRVSPMCLQCCRLFSQHGWLVDYFHSYTKRSSNSDPSCVVLTVPAS